MSNVIAVSINTSYPGAEKLGLLTPSDYGGKIIYDCARGRWKIGKDKLGKDRRNLKYVIAVYRNTVKGVFEVDGIWYEGYLKNPDWRKDQRPENATTHMGVWSFDGKDISATSKGKEIAMQWSENHKLCCPTGYMDFVE